MTHQFPPSDLDNMRLPELRQRYLEVVGEETRCPNRAYLIRRIQETLAARQQRTPSAQAVSTEQEQSPETASISAEQAQENDALPVQEPLEQAHSPSQETSSGADTRPKKHTPERAPRGRFKSMTIEELQGLYASTIGRPTDSVHRGYLTWKIREAEKGRIPIGPRETRTASQEGSSDMKILPIRLDAHTVEQLDAAWKLQGIKSRMEFFRKALAYYLEHIGANEAAALLARNPG